MEALQADNDRLKSEVERLSTELAGKKTPLANPSWNGPEEPTLRMLAEKMDADRQRIEERMATLIGETRAPPAAAIGLAKTIGILEDHGMNAGEIKEETLHNITVYTRSLKVATLQCTLHPTLQCTLDPLRRRHYSVHSAQHYSVHSIP